MHQVRFDNKYSPGPSLLVTVPYPLAAAAHVTTGPVPVQNKMQNTHATPRPLLSTTANLACEAAALQRYILVVTIHSSRVYGVYWDRRYKGVSVVV